MADDPKSPDPRILRTRLLLQNALVQLLKRKSFDEISVQDLTAEATLNRATFYAHYDDKFALLECATGTLFLRHLQERGVSFDGTCDTAIRVMLLGICDYLTEAAGSNEQGTRPMDPHMETAIIAVVRKMSVDGLQHQEPWPGPLSREMIAAMASGALFAAAKEWMATPEHAPAETIVDNVVRLVMPLVHQESLQGEWLSEHSC